MQKQWRVYLSGEIHSDWRTRIAEGDEPGSTAVILHEVDGEVIERTGHVVRLLPDLDPAGSMARVLVEIRDPLRIAEGAEPGPPLLFGTYVRVQIEGGEMEGVQVPRRAVREGGTVYVMDSANQLSTREIRIGWSLEDSVIVRSGVEAGEQVIVSRVNAPVDGMRLRVNDNSGGASDE